MNKWMWWNWCILQIVAGHKRGISTSLRPKYRFYESYWLFLMLEDTLIFLFVFSTDAGSGKAASNWCRKHRRFHKGRIQKQTHLAGRSSQGHGELGEWHKPVAPIFLPPAQPLGGGHLFRVQRGFDLFASASVSSIYKGHEREWVIHQCVCVCVRLDLFLPHWHEVGISASQVLLQTQARSGCWCQ